MKCQYQAVISTAIRRDSGDLCSREELAAQINADDANLPAYTAAVYDTAGGA